MTKHVFECIDGHTCGNPVRLVKSGGPDLDGSTMSERRQHFLKEYDWIRTGLMFEPRGHDMMSGSILYPPCRDDCDVGILFIETSGCLPMCGHGTIGTVTIALENGLVTPKEPGKLRLDTPAGLVLAEYEMSPHGKVNWVRLVNVPSFLHSQGLEVEFPDLGLLKIDVAYGGNFYGIVETQKNFRDMADFTAGELIGMSLKLRALMNEKFTFVHPEDSTICGLSHIQWTGVPLKEGSHARNAVFYGDKAIDRSPCGTGTSARIAQRHALGKLAIGEEFVHESIIGSQFIGCATKEVKLGGYDAIIPSIQGWAKVYGHNTIVIDEDDDPYAFGFQVI